LPTSSLRTRAFTSFRKDFMVYSLTVLAIHKASSGSVIAMPWISKLFLEFDGMFGALVSHLGLLTLDKTHYNLCITVSCFLTNGNRQ